jgi:hypothetical protein
LSGNRARPEAPELPSRMAGMGMMESTAGGAFPGQLSEGRPGPGGPAQGRGHLQCASLGRDYASPLSAVPRRPGRIDAGIVFWRDVRWRDDISLSICNFATLPQLIARDAVSSPISSGIGLLFVGIFTSDASANAREAAAGGCWSRTILRGIHDFTWDNSRLARRGWPAW